jgi:peroxiredoxin
LRGAYPDLETTDARIVAIGPHTNAEIVKHLATNNYPFTILGDPDGAVFAAYDVTSRIISLGQQPALFIVDTTGKVAFDAIGAQQWDLVGPDKLKAELVKLAKKSA